MSDFVTVARTEDIPPGTGKTVEVNGVWIALFNVDGSFFAVDNTCPHAGGPIGEGKLSGEIVTCPWHGWQFNVRTGERVGNPELHSRLLSGARTRRSRAGHPSARLQMAWSKRVPE